MMGEIMPDYGVKGDYNDFEDRIAVIRELKPYVVCGFTIPICEKIKGCDVIVFFENGISIPIEIERYRGDNNIFKSFPTLSIVPRKSHCKGVFIKISQDRNLCYSALFSSFNRFGMEIDRTDTKTNESMIALSTKSKHVYYGWREAAEVIKSFSIIDFESIAMDLEV